MLTQGPVCRSSDTSPGYLKISTKAIISFVLCWDIISFCLGFVILKQYVSMDRWKLNVPVIYLGPPVVSMTLIDRCVQYVNPNDLQYIPRNMYTVFALLCFVVVIHWLIFPYPSGLLHWHCGNLTNAPVPAKQPWWIWINTSCEFIMDDCITITKQSTTKPCAYFLGNTV